MKVPLVAIDGPAGAGKSTVSRRLAQALGFRYVDTGAMYRVVGVVAAERGFDLTDARALGRLCEQLDIVFADRPDGVAVLVDGRDLSAAIRTADAGQLASRVSTQPDVRTRLVAMQRRMGADGGVVMEGRDIGTVVFPDAAVKFFLTATPVERARRRCAELAARGEPVDIDEVARAIAERDRRDAERAHSPLRPAADAAVIDTTGDSIDAVVERLRAAAARVLEPLKL